MKSGEKLEKVGKVVKKLEKVAKVVKSGEKWEKVGISGESWEKVGKSGKKWGKVGKSGEKLGKVGKSGEIFRKMADRISRHFRSIRNFYLKWPPAAILEVPFGPFLDDRKSLSIAFLAISDQYTTFIFLDFFSILEVRFAPKTIGFFHYVLSMAMPNMKLIGEFVTQLEMPQAF